MANQSFLAKSTRLDICHPLRGLTKPSALFPGARRPRLYAVARTRALCPQRQDR